MPFQQAVTESSCRNVRVTCTILKCEQGSGRDCKNPFILFHQRSAQPLQSVQWSDTHVGGSTLQSQEESVHLAHVKEKEKEKEKKNKKKKKITKMKKQKKGEKKRRPKKKEKVQKKKKKTPRAFPVRAQSQTKSK